MSKLTSLILLGVVFLTPLQTRAASFSAFEETGVVQIVAYNDEETEAQSGTAFFVDFSGGCLLTATHVIVHGRGQVWNQAFLE